jgi:RNA polymerase sigma-70 factor (ECF subfamily)
MRWMEESDDSIRRAILSGDKEAYKVLMARYTQIVFRVAYRITGNESDAEEAVQEVFLRGYQALATFQGRSSMATWFYRIAANCALEVVGKRRPEAQSRIAEENDPERSEVQLADIKAGPDRLLLSREIEARQQAAMSELTPTERTAFVLRHMEDRSTEEIAAALNIAPNAAKQAVFRAVQKQHGRQRASSESLPGVRQAVRGVVSRPRRSSHSNATGAQGGLHRTSLAIHWRLSPGIRKAQTQLDPILPAPRLGSRLRIAGCCDLRRRAPVGAQTGLIGSRRS